MVDDIDKEFKVEFIGSIDDIESDNIDVYVTLRSGEKYTATFFTLRNIQRIMNRYKSSGECDYGKYFWASDMIIIENLNPLTIKESIRDLIGSGEFDSVFLKVNNDSSD